MNPEQLLLEERVKLDNINVMIQDLEKELEEAKKKQEEIENNIKTYVMLVEERSTRPITDLNYDVHYDIHLPPELLGTSVDPNAIPNANKYLHNPCGSFPAVVCEVCNRAAKVCTCGKYNKLL